MKYNRTIIAMLLFIYGCALFGCKSLLQAPTGSAQIPTIPGAIYSGTDSCIPCHDDIYRQYKKTIHYRLASSEFKWAERGCETCHGPGSLHVKSKGAIQDILSFSRLTPRRALKSACSAIPALPPWTGGQMCMCRTALAAMNATSRTRLPLLKWCTSAIRQYALPVIRRKRPREPCPPYHPVNEKKMTCGSCHNVHGTENHNLHKDTITDLCLECHAEYQGPFVYEHAPVVEDCSICHDPHGTIANNLLVQNQPFLGPRRHTGHRENPKTGPYPGLALVTSCTQCHSAVHGSVAALTAPAGKGVCAHQQLQNLFSRTPRITQALILCLLWLLVSGDIHVFAQDKTPSPDNEISVEIGSGLHFLMFPDTGEKWENMMC